MEAGPELNVLVAERLLGWVEDPLPPPKPMPPDVRPVLTLIVPDMGRRWRSPDGRHYYEKRAYPLLPSEVLPDFSRDDAAACRLMETMRQDGRGLVVKAYPAGRGLTFDYTAHDPDSDAWGHGATFAHAVCLALLRASGWEG